MITVVKKEKVPVYEVNCPECKSKIRYTANEVSLCYIACPVCKCSIRADLVFPVEHADMDPEDFPGRDFCETCANNKFYPDCHPCIDCIDDVDGILQITGTKYKKRKSIAVVVKMDIIGKIGDVVYVSDNLDEAFTWRVKHEKDLRANQRYDVYYGSPVEE